MIFYLILNLLHLRHLRSIVFSSFLCKVLINKLKALQVSKFLDRENHFPVQENGFPVQESGFPVPESCSAVQESCSAVQENCSAVQENCSAVQEIEISSTGKWFSCTRKLLRSTGKLFSCTGKRLPRTRILKIWDIRSLRSILYSIINLTGFEKSSGLDSPSKEKLLSFNSI